MDFDKKIVWENLSPTEKAMIKKMCELSFYAFLFIFFELIQGTKARRAWHIKYLCGEMQKVILGESKDSLILNMPPGSGKTEIFSIHATVWAHIVCDKVRNFNISYSDSLIIECSERIKEIIKSEPFQEMWPCQFMKDKNDHWKVMRDNVIAMQVTSKSMGGGITGGRGGYESKDYTGSVVLDDPDKPEDMFSKVKRDRTHRIISGTIKSRRASMGGEFNPTPFIIIQQRVHFDDVTGFVERGGMGKNINFNKVLIPALVNKEYIDNLPDYVRDDCIKQVCGTKKINGYWSFYPKTYSVDALIDDWEYNEYTFLSQYMQKPIKMGGTLFKSEWWVYYGQLLEQDGVGPDLQTPPYYEYRFITADTASKTKTHNDYSVFCEWGIYDGRVYLLNMFRDKLEISDLKNSFIDFVEESYDRNSKSNGILRNVYIEDASSGVVLIQDLRNAFPVPLTPVTRSTDKMTRAANVAPAVRAGRVVLPFGEKWVLDFVLEHSEFSLDDSHDHDDIVDNTMDAVEKELLLSSTNKGGKIVSSLIRKRKNRR